MAIKKLINQYSRKIAPLILLVLFVSSPTVSLVSAQVSDDVNVSANVDREPPTVTITNPNDGDTVSGNVNVTADANDDGGITKVEFYVDGLLRIIDVSAPYTFSWDTTNETNGSHTIRATAYDIINNTANDTITVTVNNVAPPPPVEEEGPEIKTPTPFRTILIDLPDLVLIGPGGPADIDFILGFIIAAEIALILLFIFLIRRKKRKKDQDQTP